MARERTALLLTLHLLILASLGGCEEATKKSPSIHMPTPHRPIAIIGRGKPGKYDLVFGGKDGKSRTWLKTGDSVLSAGMSRNFRVAAVLYPAASGKGGLLTFYDVDGKPVGSADMPTLPRLLDECRVWVGERKEAVVAFIPNRYRHIELPPHVVYWGWTIEALGSVTYYAAAGGKATLLDRDAPYPTDVAFAKSPGFAIIRPAALALPPGSKRRWRLTRFAAPGKIAWQKDILGFSPFYYTTRKGADLSLLVGRTLVHFRPNGTFGTEEMGFNPVAWNKANPGYKERTGKYYEQKDLPGAVDELAKTASLTEKEKAAARKILRTFIYDYLESFVTGGYKAVERDHGRRLAKVDKSFRDALSDEKFTKYLEWRKRRPPRGTVQNMLLEKTVWQVDASKLVVPVKEGGDG